MNKNSELVATKGHILFKNTMSKNSSDIIRFQSLKNYPNLVLSSYRHLKWHHVVRKHWQYTAVIRPYVYKHKQEVKRVCEFGGCVKSPKRFCPGDWFRYQPRLEDSFRYTNPDLVSYNNYGKC